MPNQNKPYFDEIENYFQQEIAGKTSHIKTFVPNSDRAFVNFLAVATEDDFPMLMITDYGGSLAGNEQRTIGKRTLTFVVLLAPMVDDENQQREAKNKAEYIGINIFSKLDLDEKTSDIYWLKDAFSKQNTSFNDVEISEQRFLVGMEFHIEFNFPNPLKFNKDFWK